MTKIDAPSGDLHRYYGANSNTLRKVAIAYTENFRNLNVAFSQRSDHRRNRQEFSIQFYFVNKNTQTKIRQNF
jgi:hypothetical protein